MWRSRRPLSIKEMIAQEQGFSNPFTHPHDSRSGRHFLALMEHQGSDQPYVVSGTFCLQPQSPQELALVKHFDELSEIYERKDFLKAQSEHDEDSHISTHLHSNDDFSSEFYDTKFAACFAISLVADNKEIIQSESLRKKTTMKFSFHRITYEKKRTKHLRSLPLL
ncbi:unnamed protein product [Arabis nemorensis]|uniref:Uncharacterized protein n=1 Tax=Arabis nemorensis TaxID=586526 RepID=A0A565CQ89_9BRAS|nr:unnamed protein product [Arabis nemorensis]